MVLGIDPGLDHLAWGLTDDERHCLWGTLSFGPRYGSDQQRMDLYERALGEILDRYRPHLVAIEHQFAPFRADDSDSRRRSQARAAIRLAELRAILLRMARRRGYRVAEIAPASVKKVIAGHGRATKDQVARAVRVLHGINEPLTEDESDAIAIADAALLRESGRPPDSEGWSGQLFRWEPPNDGNGSSHHPQRNHGTEDRGSRGATRPGPEGRGTDHPGKHGTLGVPRPLQ